MRRRIATISGVAGCCLAVCCLAAPSSLAAGSHHGHHGKRLILSPRKGKGYPARPIKIRVHTGRRSHDLRAQLNGHPIGQYFTRPSHHGVRRLEASLSYGLRHGQNKLHVRAGHRSQISHFRVWRGRPLVGAGVDRRVAAGDKVYLTARLRESPHHGSRVAASAGGSGSSFEWSTTSAPPGAPPGAPGDATKRRAYVATSVPGRYKVEVNATGANGQKVSDTVTLNAVPPPAVHIDTNFTDYPEEGNPLYGIQVGDHMYSAQDFAWAQLVVLNRQTLVPVSGPLANKSYTNCTQSNTDQCFNDLKSDLASLKSTQIAIVSNPCNGLLPWPASGGSFEDAMASIGVMRTAFTTAPSGRYGRCGVSAIGVPNGKPGSADWHAVRDEQSTENPNPGSMKGYLFRTNGGDYRFAPTDRIAFDTQADDSSPSSNVIRVGDQTFPQSFDGGIGDGGGFQVVVLDAQTLGVTSSKWFETDHSSRQALIDQLDQMRTVLHQANDDTRPQLVFIASLGDPAIQYYQRNGITSPDRQLDESIKSLVDEVERLGGTRNAFYTMIDPGLYDHNSYTLVSTSASGPAQGLEQVDNGISGNGTGPLNTDPATGVLAPTGPNYSYRVETSQISDASGAAAAAAAGDPTQGVLDLWKVAFQDPTPWPDQGPRAQDQARHNAIEWIGQHAKDLGTSDPRAAYWTKDYSEGTWNRIAFEIQGLTYPSTRPDPYFSEQDLNWAKEELAGPKTDPPLVGGEILWLERTHTYLDTLAKPFTSNGLKEWAAVSGITNDIKTQVDTTSDAPVQAANKAWSDFARQLIAEVVPEKVQGPAYILNDIYELASTLSEINGKPVEDEFDSTTSNVGNDLADRMKKSQDLLQIQLANTIAADYGKLSTVGSCLQATAEDAPCPFNRADWQLNQDYQAQAEQLITPATKAWAYSVLLPARYTAWSLPVWWRTKVDQSFSGNEGTHPFAGIPDSAQVAVPVYRNIPTYGHTLTRGNPWTLNPGSDAWHVFALGRLDGQGTFFKPWTMQFPAASVTDKLFNAPDEHHPDNLGVDPETFFDRSFKPKPLEHYPDDGSDPPQWCFAYGDPCN